MKKRVFASIALLLLIFTFSSCVRSAGQQAKIKEMFESFPVTEEQYVLLTSDFLLVGDKQTPRSDLAFDGEICRHIVCLENGMYAYTYVSGTDKASANILWIPYDTLTPELLKTITVDTSIIDASYCDGGLYFRISGAGSGYPKNYFYFIYNITTGETHMENCEDPYRLSSGTDHNRSMLYRMTRSPGAISNRYEITDKASGKTKEITKNVLKNCKEGKEILKKGKLKFAITDVEPVYEKDGDIYLFSTLLDDGFLGYPQHCFILKYDFESETTTFYTWIYFEEHQDLIDFFIP